MADISYKTESWNGHTRSEVESFVKPRLLSEAVPSEHVTVIIRGCTYDAGNGSNALAPVTGGTLVVKSWDPATASNRPDMEITIPAPAAGASESVVEFDVPYGVHYAVRSKVEGLGASFELCFAASLEDRTVYLWNIALGVWKARTNWVWSDAAEKYLGVLPAIAPVEEDITDDAWYDFGDREAYVDDNSHVCVLLSTADFSALLAPNYKASSMLAWSKINIGRNVPALEEFYVTVGGDSAATRALAIADFDSALNTDKILTALSDAPAAQFAEKSINYNFTQTLPSAGVLKAIYDNKAAVNQVIADIGDSNFPALDNNAYWSSSAYDRLRSCGVSEGNGNVFGSGKDNENSVLSVSAFLYQS